MLHRVSLYGQVLLDELKINELIANKGWFGNKYGVQLGAKYIDMLGIDHLDGQLEYNVVRPYTYSHRDAYANYTHYNQPLAHPLGANFQEVVALVRYQPMPKLLLKAKLIAAQTGKDTARVNTAGTLVTYTQNTYGNNPLRPYTDAPNGYGNTIGQGSPSNILTLALIASYQLRHNLFIDFTAISRRENNPLPYYQNTMNYVGVGLRLNAATRSVDY